MATEAPKPHYEKRPWGEEIWFTQNISSTVKLLTINPGESLSLQKHSERDEFWYIIEGDGTAVIGNQTVPLNPGDNHFVPRESDHRIIGGKTTLRILEISLGQFDESDIIRLEDKYGRLGNGT